MGRSTRDIAEKCGVSNATFSRIAKTFNSPVKVAILLKNNVPTCYCLILLLCAPIETIYHGLPLIRNNNSINYFYFKLW